jgi:hypothetical protein
MTPMGGCWYGRLLARHLGKYLPGGPSVVALNKPGAGSLNLANYIYNVAPRDGSEIAIVGRGVVADPMLNGNASNAMFDATRFACLGSMNNEVSGFYIRQPSPAAGLADILGGRNLKVGATGAGGDQQVFTAALNSLLGTRLTTIGGYPAPTRSCSRSNAASWTASSAIHGEWLDPATTTCSNPASSRLSCSWRSASTRNCRRSPWSPIS